jgi:toxin FitB
MRQVVLDTDVASLIIKQRLPASLLHELVGAQTGITFVTLGELARWATMRQWGDPRRADLTRWLGLAVIGT